MPDSKLCGGVLLNCGILPSAASICNVRPGLCVRYYQMNASDPAGTGLSGGMRHRCPAGTARRLGHLRNRSLPPKHRRQRLSHGLGGDPRRHHPPERPAPHGDPEGFSHMAVYLRWCIEHNLMSEAFQQDFPKEIQKVLENEDDYFDLRTVIRDELAAETAPHHLQRGGRGVCRLLLRPPPQRQPALLPRRRGRLCASSVRRGGVPQRIFSG